MKKRTGSKRTVSVKAFVAILALVLALGCAAGGTFAWLVTKTDPVVNTFTYGDINITLTETTGDNYKIIPGVAISKDPKVTVKANSEACWLFVKVEEANWPAFTEEGTTTKKVSYAIASGWTALPNVPGVYYRELDFTSVETSYGILANDKVTVSQNLTKTEVNSIAAGTRPTLTFTAYAIQKEGFTTAAAAWAEASK